MSTGLLDLTDEFVSQFQELRTEYEKLRSRSADGPVAPPSPKQTEQINQLTQELASLKLELEEALESAARARREVSKSTTGQQQEIEEIKSQAQQQIDIMTAESNKLKREIHELRGKVEQLEFRIQQVKQSPASREGISFDKAFPTEFNELKDLKLKLKELKLERNKLSELVTLYERRHGPII